MGQSFKLQCCACGYGKELMIGVGMMYLPENVFFGHGNEGKPLLDDLVFDKKIKQKAHMLLDNGATPCDGYMHTLYVCPECNRLYNYFYFRLQANGVDYEPMYKCSYCSSILLRAELDDNGEKLKLLDHNNHEIVWKCPKCGNDKIEHGHESNMILWD